MPGLGTNLFSMSAATSSGLEARFSKDLVFFHRGDDLVLTGKRSGNTLYLLDLKPHTASITSTSRIDSTYRAGLRASLLVWHQRLGHEPPNHFKGGLRGTHIWSPSDKWKDPENTLFCV